MGRFMYEYAVRMCRYSIGAWRSRICISAVNRYPRPKETNVYVNAFSCLTGFIKRQVFDFAQYKRDSTGLKLNQRQLHEVLHPCVLECGNPLIKAQHTEMDNF